MCRSRPVSRSCPSRSRPSHSFAHRTRLSLLQEIAERSAQANALIQDLQATLSTAEDGVASLARAVGGPGADGGRAGAGGIAEGNTALRAPRSPLPASASPPPAWPAALGPAPTSPEWRTAQRRASLAHSYAQALASTRQRRLQEALEAASPAAAGAPAGGASPPPPRRPGHVIRALRPRDAVAGGATPPAGRERAGRAAASPPAPRGGVPMVRAGIAALTAVGANSPGRAPSAAKALFKQRQSQRTSKRESVRRKLAQTQRELAEGPAFGRGPGAGVVGLRAVGPGPGAMGWPPPRKPSRLGQSSSLTRRKALFTSPGGDGARGGAPAGGRGAGGGGGRGDGKGAVRDEVAVPGGAGDGECAPVAGDAPRAPWQGAEPGDARAPGEAAPGGPGGPGGADPPPPSTPPFSFTFPVSPETTPSPPRARPVSEASCQTDPEAPPPSPASPSPPPPARGRAAPASGGSPGGGGGPSPPEMCRETVKKGKNRGKPCRNRALPDGLGDGLCGTHRNALALRLGKASYAAAGRGDPLPTPGPARGSGGPPARGAQSPAGPGGSGRSRTPAAAPGHAAPPAHPAACPSPGEGTPGPPAAPTGAPPQGTPLGAAPPATPWGAASLPEPWTVAGLPIAPVVVSPPGPSPSAGATVLVSIPITLGFGVRGDEALPWAVGAPAAVPARPIAHVGAEGSDTEAARAPPAPAGGPSPGGGAGPAAAATAPWEATPQSAAPWAGGATVVDAKATGETVAVPAARPSPQTVAVVAEAPSRASSGAGGVDSISPWRGASPASGASGDGSSGSEASGCGRAGPGEASVSAWGEGRSCRSVSSPEARTPAGAGTPPRRRLEMGTVTAGRGRRAAAAVADTPARATPKARARRGGTEERRDERIEGLRDRRAQEAQASLSMQLAARMGQTQGREDRVHWRPGIRQKRECHCPAPEEDRAHEPRPWRTGPRRPPAPDPPAESSEEDPEPPPPILSREDRVRVGVEILELEKEVARLLEVADSSDKRQAAERLSETLDSLRRESHRM